MKVRVKPERLSPTQEAALKELVRRGRMDVHSVRANDLREGKMNLHTAWSLEERGLARLRDAYIETVAWPTPLATQLLRLNLH